MDKRDIEKYITDSDIELASELSYSDDDGLFIAFVKISREDGRQVPTNFHIAKVRRYLAEAGIIVDFILIDDVSTLVSTLKYALFSFFPELVRDVFASEADDGVSVWYVPKISITDQNDQEIRGRISKVLMSLGFSSAGIYSTAHEKLPTPTALLTALRVLAPAMLSDIEAEVKRRGLSLPSEAWLSHALDKLRKDGFLIRGKDQAYALTMAGLAALGTSKDRRSADVQRVLAMNRRSKYH